MGPAESFVADTIVPPVLLEPLALKCGCKPRDDGKNGHDHPRDEDGDGG